MCGSNPITKHVHIRASIATAKRPCKPILDSKDLAQSKNIGTVVREGQKELSDSAPHTVLAVR